MDQPNPAPTYDDAADTVQQGGTVVDSDTIDYNYAQYEFDLGIGSLDYPPPVGAFDRRVLALPIAECTTDDSGQSTLDVVGFGCYFLLQEVQQQGTEAQIFGQFLEGCNAGGLPGPAPVDSPAPYRIQLYKDTDSSDS